MVETETLNIAIAMLYQPDVYHLQLRNGTRQKGAIGLLGCFGGEIKLGETPKQAAVRELGEETNIFHGLKAAEINNVAEKLREIDEVEVTSDHNGKIIPVKAHIIEVLLELGTKVYTLDPKQEGEVVTKTREEIIQLDEKLTPATQKFYRRYFEYGPEHN